MNSKNIGVVLPAGGLGKRFGTDKPKQLIELNGKPLFKYAVDAFHSIEVIQQIAFVYPESWKDYFLKELEPYDKITLVAGGEQRWQSVRNGVLGLNSSIEYILAHDVARPFVTSEIIYNTIDAVMNKGACLVAKPVVDTVKVVGQGVVEDTINRDKVYLAQTPQAFTRGQILKAYQWIEDHPHYHPTDESGLLEKLNENVFIVEGNDFNNKITKPLDLKIMSALLEKE